jgi:DNA-directed RNA polymerase specialized sigma24 family protein
VQESEAAAQSGSPREHALGRHRHTPATRNAGRSGPAKNRSTRRDFATRQADQALRALYESHYRALTQMAALLVGDPAAAEQIVQNAFVAMHRAWRMLGTGDAALLYLRRQVVRRARCRRPGRRGTARQIRWPCLPGSSAAPCAVAMLRTLPARQREAVILRCWAGLSDAQIAAVTGGRLQAVPRNLRRGLAALTTAPTRQDRHPRG